MLANRERGLTIILIYNQVLIHLLLCACVFVLFYYFYYFIFLCTVHTLCYIDMAYIICITYAYTLFDLIDPMYGHVNYLVLGPVSNNHEQRAAAVAR